MARGLHTQSLNLKSMPLWTRVLKEPWVKIMDSQFYGVRELSYVVYEIRGNCDRVLISYHILQIPCIFPV